MMSSPVGDDPETPNLKPHAAEVKIALFSLGNLAVHSECRAELNSSSQAQKVLNFCTYG